MSKTAPVQDWTTDFDVMDPDYVSEPYPVWNDLRDRCPVARTERRRGAWLLTTYEGVNAAAHDTATFSSLDVGVVNTELEEEDLTGALEYGLPPISADAPLHTWTRRILLPWFSHSRVAEYEPITRQLCRKLIANVIDSGHADAAADYAQQIPVRIIGLTLGVPDELSDTFTGWVRDVLEFADDKERVIRGRDGIVGYLLEEAARRQDDPQDNLISELVHLEHDGEPIPAGITLGMCALVLIAGIDTTWSAIGSSLWHLANNPDDLTRLVSEPELMETAVEEFLRAYSPVTMARVVTADTEFAGCPMKAEDKVLLSFPAANRDPAAFERANEVVLDRAVNRHVAFGAGIHRCAGSNLARMELRVAIEEWIAAIPSFRVADGAEVTWAGGQVRGPRSLPVVFP